MLQAREFEKPKGLVIIYVEGGWGEWEKNVGHVKFSMWPTYYGMQTSSDPPLSINYFNYDPPSPTTSHLLARCL